MRGSFIVAQLENTIQNRKNKHLSAFERGQIEALHKDGHTNREIGRRLGRVHQTIANELERGTTTQLQTGRTPYTAYFAETGQAIYERNRLQCGAKSKLLIASEFIDFACEKILDEDWSPDAVVGFISLQNEWIDRPTVSTKTLYNYIDLDILRVRNIDLPMKLRRNTKVKRIRRNRRILGMSIAERPVEIDNRQEFGHWEIDTVEGQKSDDNALLTLVERKTRNYYAILLDDQDHDSVDYAMNQLRQDFGELFPQVFKTITSDNGSEFSNLTTSLQGVTDVYFARPYAPYERGSNERHNGLLRRYIPKGKAISDYSTASIQHIYQTLNQLPRKILNYRQPSVLFEQELARLA
ncbi:IS30 family transposase [Sporosarcina sp. P26b]|nr:IS30 family transposase [Sporosarcina ureae]ARK20193.1 integrase [Sporosarcina ureae]ARK22797.1 integrase [Sporosarcina ureae]PIC73399.1 IS30 family transposase [Sporosarcina sp. P17b]PIC94505.1 IS30 family transposase [Sporosarcina sp. P26b]